MRWQLRSVLAANQAIIDHLTAKSVESVDDLLQLAANKTSVEALKTWAEAELQFQRLDATRLSHAIVSFRKAQAAARQTASGAVLSGTRHFSFAFDVISLLLMTVVRLRVRNAGIFPAETTPPCTGKARLFETVKCHG
jgi:hypothetical protein